MNRTKSSPRSMQAQSAFTLIELLVVIAIIAILAAILFPVFAQAREKARQSSCLSNQKQITLAAMQYVQDFDETYPLGGSYNGTAWHISLHDTPVDWRLAPPTDSFRARQGSYWANSVQTYMKNRDVFRCPGAALDFENAGLAASYAAAAAAGRPVYSNSYTYNGLLHAYPDANMDEPANVIMLSETTGKIAYRGFASTEPSAAFLANSANPNAIYLPKTATGCATTPSGADGSGAPVANTSTGYIKEQTLWVHNGGMNMGFADGHVKWRRVGAQIAPAATDRKVDPWTNYNPQGKPGSSYWDGCHYCLFRPKVNPNAISDFCKM